MVAKGLGGWSLKNIFLFVKSLASKGGWILIKYENLWMDVMIHKYLALDSVEDWIRNPRKSYAGGSVIWKDVVQSFGVIESKLAWNAGDGRQFRIGEDPWAHSTQQHKLPTY